MFEKDSEEYVRKIWHDVINWDGAELEERFYNEIKFKQAYLAGAELGYNKTNEWHFVKDGDLPKHEVNVLVLYNVQCIDIAHYNYDYKEWHFRDSIVRDVIAWCELPKLPKFEE